MTGFGRPGERPWERLWDIMSSGRAIHADEFDEAVREDPEGFWEDCRPGDDRGTILVNRVGRGERVDADDVEVDEDVAGEVLSRTVRVGGDVLPGARITVRGAGASIHVEGDVSADTVLTAEGCDAEVVVEGDVG